MSGKNIKIYTLEKLIVNFRMEGIIKCVYKLYNKFVSYLKIFELGNVVYFKIFFFMLWCFWVRVFIILFVYGDMIERSRLKSLFI